VSDALESDLAGLSPWLSMTAATVLLAAAGSSTMLPAVVSVAPFVAVVSTLGLVVDLVSLRAALTKLSASTDCVRSVPGDDFVGGAEAAPLWLAGTGLSDGDVCGVDVASGEGGVDAVSGEDCVARPSCGRSAGFGPAGAGGAGGEAVAAGGVSLGPSSNEENGVG
jgi:hypothetical protein